MQTNPHSLQATREPHQCIHQEDLALCDGRSDLTQRPSFPDLRKQFLQGF